MNWLIKNASKICLYISGLTLMLGLGIVIVSAMSALCGNFFMLGNVIVGLVLLCAGAILAIVLQVAQKVAVLEEKIEEISQETELETIDE